MSRSGQGTLDSWLSIKPAAAASPTASASSSTTENHNHNHSHSNSNIDSDRASFMDRGRVHSRQRDELAAVATETRTVLPDILQRLPHIAAARSEDLYLDRLAPLKAADCPRRTPSGKTPIRIVNEDTFNAAIALASSKGRRSGRVAVLNMASHVHPGGGWLKGALAQEEALCYRSSLSLSLHKRYYPWKQSQGLYTADVVIIRSDMPSGHKLLVPDVKPEDLPVMSVLSIAAPRTPKTRRVQTTTTMTTKTTPGRRVVEREVYEEPAARELMKGKMRLCLRMAAHRGHGLLVLGALGCGAFRNPREEVAACWLEVLREAEFRGGWWEEMWFAVYDRRNEGNYEVFDDVLGGVEV